MKIEDDGFKLHRRILKQDIRKDLRDFAFVTGYKVLELECKAVQEEEFCSVEIKARLVRAE